MKKLDSQYMNSDAPLEEWVQYYHEDGCSGVSRCLHVLRCNDGWHYNCKSCGMAGFARNEGVPPPSWLNDIRQNKSYNKEIQLPWDYATDVPKKGLRWLYKYGIMDTEIETHRIGYSKYLDRVILPVYSGGRLITWQGRYLEVPDKLHPKYMTARGAKFNTLGLSIIADGHGPCLLYTSPSPRDRS